MDDAPLMTQPERERCETSNSSVTASMCLRKAGSPQAPAEAVAVAARGRESAHAVFALALARQTGPARKEAGCRWQPAWLGGGLWCHWSDSMRAGTKGEVLLGQLLLTLPGRSLGESQQWRRKSYRLKSKT